MNLTPPPQPTSWSSALPFQPGLEALKNGKVAVVLLAGGLGSRLGWEGPKGTFPITPYRKKTLFQLFSDKIEAASHCFGHKIPVAILASKNNIDETKSCFKQSDFSICEQGELPYLDEHHQPLPYFGPDGNGGVFHVLERQGLLQKWEEAGVELITTLLVENPLADPVDPQWISFHLNGHYDLTLKVIRKDSPDEKVGLLVENNGHLQIVEYNELEKKEGFDFANISLLLMNLSIARESAKKIDLLPLHLQWKKIKEGLWGWKQERYIFDNFMFAKKIAPLLYPREKTFVPLKTIDDLEKVQRALSKREREILGEIIGMPVDDSIQEIDPSFYYPTPNLKKRWHGRTIEKTHYIDGEKQ